MIYYATPKILLKSYFKYCIFEVNDEGRMIRIDLDNNLNIVLKHAYTSPVIRLWNRSYDVENFISNISKDCTIFTKESHPEYFI